MIFNKTRSFPRIARVIAAALVLAGASCSGDSRPVTRTVLPSTGTIKKYISTTGTVEPRNRLKIIPAIAGRVEKVLVTEGQEVRRGQLLAWLHGALRGDIALDGARGGKHQEIYLHDG
ncbi:MAG TPA: efflux RND transporter periplasmic adaptor subunit, partial [Spirochaetota bacterium]|nr:efflux RND transporter periplasmic adaptor subunit [Spirochaetota bacterium]